MWAAALSSFRRCWRARFEPALATRSETAHTAARECLRSEALLTSPPLTNWLSNLQRDLPLTHLTLDSLTFDATLQLVQSLAYRRATDAHLESSKSREVETREHKIEQFGRWLFAETSGQPFFIIETLRVLLERETLVPHRKEDGTWVVDFKIAMGDETKLLGLLPPHVREMIRARLVRLL